MGKDILWQGDSSEGSMDEETPFLKGGNFQENYLRQCYDDENKEGIISSSSI